MKTKYQTSNASTIFKISINDYFGIKNACINNQYLEGSINTKNLFSEENLDIYFRTGMAVALLESRLASSAFHRLVTVLVWVKKWIACLP